MALFSSLDACSTVNATVVDEIDRRIIRTMQANGRMSVKDLGQEVGLSANATGVRVGRLMGEGIITGVHAQVDHALLGRGLEAYVDCWLAERGEADWERFEQYVADDDRVLEAVHITGKVDYRLQVVVASPSELDAFLRGLKRDANVAETDTRLVLRRVYR